MCSCARRPVVVLGVGRCTVSVAVESRDAAVGWRKGRRRNRDQSVPLVVRCMFLIVAIHCFKMTIKALLFEPPNTKFCHLLATAERRVSFVLHTTQVFRARL